MLPTTGQKKGQGACQTGERRTSPEWLVATTEPLGRSTYRCRFGRLQGARVRTPRMHGGHRRSTSGCSTRLPLALLAVHSLLDDRVARTDLLELDLGSTGRSADRSNAINHLCQSPWCLDTLQPPPGPSSIPAGPAPRPGQPLDFWSRRHRPGLRHPTALALSLTQPPQATTTKRRQIRQKPCAGPTASRAQPRSRRGRLQRPPGRIYLRPIRKLTGPRARGHDAARSASAARVQQRHHPPPLPRPGASGGGDGLSTGRRRTQAARRPRA